MIFRKGQKRPYKTNDEKQLRRESSFFWEERNIWFSDLWDIKGTKQSINSNVTRERNASFPFEIPYRLINMYSQKNDVVLDPFAGLCTTMKAAILCQRNFIGYDIDDKLSTIIADEIENIDLDKYNSFIKNRFDTHKSFVYDREFVQKKPVKHFNNKLNCKVMTGQEEDIEFNYIKSISMIQDNCLTYEVEYIENSDLNDLPYTKKGQLF